MLRKDFNWLAPALLVLALLAGCGDDDEGPRPLGFEVDASALPPIAAGKGHYEAWIAFPEPSGKGGPGSQSPLHGELELISIGKFQVDGAGDVLDLEGQPISWSLRPDRDPNFAAEGWISIEVEGDIDTIPGGLLLAGDFTGTADRATATLSSGYHSVFDLENNLDLGTLSGTYTLETPSDVISANEDAGLYFESGGQPGLNFPELDGEKIVYEGWLESGGVFESTGRFVRADTLDSDGAGFPGAGGTTPEFPGQELVLPTPADLNDGSYRVMLTLEPADDNDPDAPSPFVLLADSISAGAATGIAYPIASVTAALPTVSIVINR